jgi:uncharacterized spore protein YtfJ
MENGNFLEKLSSQFGQSASVKNVFGEPVQAGGKTIIPVAQIAFGVGGGQGQGKKKMLRKAGEETPDEAVPSGEGGGGGMYARPKGVFEITDGGTRFIPASNPALLFIGLGIGFLLRGWLRHRR